MIEVDITVAISAYLSFSLFLVFAFWLLYNCPKANILNDKDFVQQCPYCTFVFTYFLRNDSGEKQEENNQVADSQKSTSFNNNTAQNKSSYLVCPKCRSFVTLTKQK